MRNKNPLIAKLLRNKQAIANMNHAATLEKLATYKRDYAGQTISRDKLGAYIFNCHANVKDLHSKLMILLSKDVLNLGTIERTLDGIKSNLHEIKMSEKPVKISFWAHVKNFYNHWCKITIVPSKRNFAGGVFSKYHSKHINR